MKKDLTKKIKSYIKRYSSISFKTKKIMNANELIENRRIFAIYPRIKRYSFFIIKGKRGTYIAIKNLYCSCIGFTASLMRNKVKPCYHLLAIEMIKEEQLNKIFIRPNEFYNIALTKGLDYIFQS